MKPFFISISSLFLLFSLVHGQIPDVPTNYITDIRNYVEATQEAALNDTLQVFERTTTHQIFVLISDTTGGRDIDEIGPELGEKWGVGQAGKDNGVLITLFVKDRALRIDVGYGLEGDLTDYQTALIRKNTMEPLLRQERYGDAIEAGVFEIINTLQKVEVEQFTPYRRHSISNEKIGLSPVIWWSDNTLNIHWALLLVFLVIEIFMSFKLWGLIVKKYLPKLIKTRTRRGMLWGCHAILFACICIIALSNSDQYYSVYIVEINNVSHWVFISGIGFWGMIPLGMWLYKWKKTCEINEIKGGNDEKSSDLKIDEWGFWEILRSFLAYIFFGFIIWFNYGLLFAWIIGEVESEPAAVLGTIVSSATLSFTFYAIYISFLEGGRLGSGGSSFSSSGRSSFGSGTFSSGGGSSWGGGGFGGGGGGSFGGGGSSGSW